MLLVGPTEYLALVGPRGGEEALVVHAGDHILELSVAVFCSHPGIEGLDTGCEDDGSDVDLFFLRRLREIDGLVLTYRFADTALLLFQVEAALVDVGDQRDCLGEVDVNCFVRRYVLIELIRVFHRAVFYTGRAARALVFLYVAGLLDQRHLEVTRFPLYAVDFSIGEDRDVGMPADLDQLGCEYSHRAVVGRKGLVELGHMAPDARRLLDQVDLEPGAREIEGGLDAADASADDHDVAEITLS
jgi:hypothetical protein